MCKDIGAVALIDDSLKYALQCSETLKHVILFGNYGWNKNVEPLPENVTRVTSWVDIPDVLNSILEEI